MIKKKLIPLVIASCLLSGVSIFASSNIHNKSINQNKNKVLLSAPSHWTQSKNGAWKYIEQKISNGENIDFAVTGWQSINNTWYYFNNNGIMQTGWQSINGDWYYLNDSGAMQTGWLNLNGTWYYLNGSGIMQTEWYCVGNSWYHFNSNGAMQTGWQSLDSHWYYFNNSGVMQSGWTNIKGSWYYINAYGELESYWINSASKWYYSNNDGVMQTGWQHLNNNWYYFDDSGVMQTGWYNVNNAWYYFNNNGAMQTGWQSINGDWYYLNGSGVMQTGWYNINNTWYYMADSGIMRTGWLSLSGKSYFLNKSGAMQTGTIVMDNMAYTFNESGVLVNQEPASSMPSGSYNINIKVAKQSLTIPLNGNFNYSMIGATTGKNVSLTYSGTVNTKKIGVYKIKITSKAPNGSYEIMTYPVVVAPPSRFAGNLEIYNTTQNVIKNSTTDKEKAQAIFIWIAKNISYDYTYYNAEQAGKEDYAQKMEERTAINTFNRKTSVCDGFSALYVVMAKDAGLKVKDVYGSLYSKNGTLLGAHAWNEVYIDNTWVSLDVTSASSIFHDKAWASTSEAVKVKSALVDCFNNSDFNTTHKYKGQEYPS